MAFSKELEQAMEDQAFADRVGSMETKEDITAAFAERGIDIEQEMGLDEGEAELDESALENVAGGMSTIEVFARAAKGAWKVGTSAGIILRAFYDAKRYGDPYRSYSKEKVDSLIRKIDASLGF